jgi:hypothetical protein
MFQYESITSNGLRTSSTCHIRIEPKTQRRSRGEHKARGAGWSRAHTALPWVRSVMASTKGERRWLVKPSCLGFDPEWRTAACASTVSQPLRSGQWVLMSHTDGSVTPSPSNPNPNRWRESGASGLVSEPVRTPER